MNHEAGAPALPDILAILADKFPGNAFFQFAYLRENVSYSLFLVLILGVIAFFACRKKDLVPGRLQGAAEIIVGGLDEFVRGMLGDKGRKYTPFIGTLFMYIFFMNIAGLVPFLKSPAASWSTTMALALCVFFYVQYTGIREMGFLGYLDHMAGKPRGILAFTVVMPVFMLVLHIISELIRPVSLSLRLRGNIWGDEVLLGLLSGFGLTGFPLLFFNMSMALLTAVVQAVVFCLLTTIYFALVINNEEAV
ncbi:MAG: F0F1 ATP synthase subunit A [Candidatus Omnitrophica bacterium]|nr:F0F1 ATP synthase subunit A [Candidatus Omnitrophota bacterium]